MARRFLAYTEIAQSKRSAAGHAYIKPLRDALKNPGLDPGERAVIEAEIQKVNDWINGNLAVTPPGVPELTR